MHGNVPFVCEFGRAPFFECALVLIAHISLGSESKPETLANFRFTPESGLKSDIAACPKSANSGSCAISNWRPKFSLDVSRETQPKGTICS
jgi:hypothetical protein